MRIHFLGSAGRNSTNAYNTNKKRNVSCRSNNTFILDWCHCIMELEVTPPSTLKHQKKKAERKGGEDEENHKEKHQNKSLLFSLTRPLASDTWSMQCECAKRPREMNKHTPNTVAVHLQHTPIPAAVPLHCIPPVQLSLSPGRMLDVTVLSSFIFLLLLLLSPTFKKEAGKWQSDAGIEGHDADT